MLAGEGALPPPQRRQGQGISAQRSHQGEETDRVRGAHRPAPALRAAEADAHHAGGRRGAAKAGNEACTCKGVVTTADATRGLDV